MSIVLFSSLITLVTTGIQLYVDYRRDISWINEYMGMIRGSYLGSLANSVWMYDDAQIEMQLSGLLRLPDIEFLEVRAGDDFAWTAGVRTSRYTIEDELPLIQTYKGRKVPIGRLRVVAGVDTVLGRLLHRVLIILAANAFKTFLVAGFILMLFQLRVTRHLMRIAEYFGGLDLSRPAPPLVLDRGASDSEDDELEQLVTAINNMQADLFRYLGERDRAGEALRESEEKYRILVDNAGEAIAVAQDERLKFFNRKLLDITGYRPEELTARPIMDFVHPDDGNLLARRYCLRLEGLREPAEYEFRILRKSGEVCWIDLKLVVIEWEGRTATLNFMSDITGRKRAEAEKEKLESQLRQSKKMEAIGTLAGGVAHDFNNLLQAINGYTQLLQMDKSEDHPDYPNLAAISTAGGRAADLVRQLLLFSRKLEAARRPIDLNLDVERAVRLLERTIPKMIDLDLHLERRLWTINADAVQMEQILLNLGRNAADAMPHGGRLTIKTENMPSGHDHVPGQSGPCSGRFVVLTVSDTGHGMDSETREHIFEPFYTTREIGRGTGLGLASAYGIVDSHGGHITCDSEVGRGTVFKVYLPALEGAGPAVEDEDRNAPHGGEETILLVDDEVAVRDFAAQALTRFGYNILTASTGEEALEIYAEKSDNIDLVILDIGMPGMGGHRCFREIVDLDPSARVIIASGYSATGQLRETLAAGAAGYVPKPYQLQELLDKVREVLDGGLDTRAVPRGTKAG